jgi:superfamily I DNA and/or RNA helicase
LGIDDIAVAVAHRDQRGHVRGRLDDALIVRGLPTGSVVVDTANRLQGRQFQLVVAWHPLSGRRDASAFHLEAGRLCVMLSRHRLGCIVVGRAGIRNQLEAHPATEPVWVGEAPPAVDGWEANLSVIDTLEMYPVVA